MRIFILLLVLGTLSVASCKQEDGAVNLPASDPGEGSVESPGESGEDLSELLQPVCSAKTDFCLEPGFSLPDLLSPHVMEPASLAEIRTKLREGKAVVIHDAFIPEFADAMHKELLILNYTLEERFDPDGFQVSQHNIYKWEDYTELLTAFHYILESDVSKEFMHDLSGRDTFGSLRSGASWFAPRGYVLPHDDHREVRTVSYVWHLSKDWRPEWGGALYWCPEDHAHAYVHASYNTLTLFSVTAKTIHMVTPVSPHATERRLTFNGWYGAEWFPSVEDDLVSHLDTEKKRRELTENQITTLFELIANGELTKDMEEKVSDLMTMAQSEAVGPPRFTHVLGSNDEAVEEE